MFKKIGKFFKKIGRGIKKGFKKFGKFMGKLGIVGQIAMMFIMPGIGNAMMSTFGSVLKGLGTLGRVGQAAQTVLGAAGNFTRLVAKPFTTITDGISTFLSNTTKFLTNKTAGLLGKEAVFQGAPTTFLGADGVIGQTATNISNNVAGFADIGRDLVSNDISAFTDRSFGSLREARTKEMLSNERDVTSGDPFGLDQMKQDVMSGTVNVGEAASTKTSLLDRITDPFTPTKLVEGFAQGTAKGVTNVASTAALDAVGLGPEYEEYGSQRGFTPQFQSDQSLLSVGYTPLVAVDQGGADVTGQETYANMINRLTVGNQSGVGYGGNQNYNNWLNRSVSGFA
tara:strand:- start:7832 stop:8851 length:1020 start_codon:yes stop_codon:yes gene_type:complete